VGTVMMRCMASCKPNSAGSAGPELNMARYYAKAV